MTEYKQVDQKVTPDHIYSSVKIKYAHVNRTTREMYKWFNNMNIFRNINN